MNANKPKVILPPNLAKVWGVDTKGFPNEYKSSFLSKLPPLPSLRKFNV